MNLGFNGIKVIWSYSCSTLSTVCQHYRLSHFIPTRTLQLDKHAILRGAFQRRFLMGNKSVSRGVDDTRGTPQGAHPFRCGHQGFGLFIRFHYSYLIRTRHPLLERRRSRCTHPNAKQTKRRGSSLLFTFCDFPLQQLIQTWKYEGRGLKPEASHSDLLDNQFILQWHPFAIKCL